MKKLIYILAMLFYLAATFGMFCFVGCESQVSAKPTLYVWTTVGCGSCLKQKPMVDAIAATGRVIVVKADIEDEPARAAAMGVTDAPTYILFVGGREVWRGYLIRPIYEQCAGAR